MDELKEVNISIWVDVCVSDYTNQDIDDFHVDQEKHIKGVIPRANSVRQQQIALAHLI